MDLPSDKNPIDCKQGFKAKRNCDGSIIQQKVCLVIKSYAQKKSIDYEETYAPVVCYNTIRVLLSLAV